MYYYNLGTYLKDVALRFCKQSAIKSTEESLSYAELLERSYIFANHLLEHGCKKGDVVAIAHTKQIDSYVLMCACLMVGVAYVNIDVDSPKERNKSILETCQAKLIFGDQSIHVPYLTALADELGGIFKYVDDFDLCPLNEKQMCVINSSMFKTDSASIAYIMFTSGSTGTPKGVAVTHQNILHFIEWGRSCFSISQRDTFANLSPMYFDNSVFDFYIALFSGATLVPIRKDVLSDPLRLVSTVEEMKCTIWFSVPSLLIYLMSMKVLSKGRLATIRSFSFGGEGYPKVELKKLYDMYSDKADLVNVYGPTECTCICSAHQLSSQDFDEMGGLPTLGKLNQNFDYMILDESGARSSTGELCLIGPNVAAGYFNDVERTQKAFYTLEQPKYYKKRMYKTGDLVEEKHGKLYFIGRKDNQIKHMGYRIELEEIELAIQNIPEVTQVVVLYNRSNTSYGKIVAYIATEYNLDNNYLIEELGKILPSYMIPNQFYTMVSLPKNANGKVDRSALIKSI